MKKHCFCLRPKGGKHLPLAMCLAFFILISLRLINRDFYYDEIFSLRNYIFVPFRDILLGFDYFNNHFFFSLLNSCYVKVLNLNLFWLMDKPFVIRIPQLCIALLTIVYIHKLGLLLSERTALFSTLLLITTIPFYYYSMLVRGYGLSMLLMTMLIYYIKRE